MVDETAADGGRLEALLQNFLHALMQTGVAVCGGMVVQPLTGRTEVIGPRN